MKSTHWSILGVTTMLVTLSPQMAAALEKIGVVGIAGTTVTATGEDGVARTLKTGDNVYLNDHVVSDAKGDAQLIFLDRSTLTLNKNTDLTLDTYVYDPKAASGTMAVSSVKGAFRFVGGALSKKQPVTIKTPVATIGIRGGIADTHIMPGTGASDAVFVYGDALTMTNQNGETSTTTQIGTGLMLDNPLGMPAPMPPELVSQRMQSFEAVAPAPGAENGGNGDQGSNNTNNSGGGNSGNAPGVSTPASNSGDSGGSGFSNAGTTIQLVDAGSEPIGAPITFVENVGNLIGNVAQNTSNEEIKTAAVAGDETVLPGVTNIPQVAENLPPATEGGTANPPSNTDSDGDGEDDDEDNVVDNTTPLPPPPPPATNTTPPAGGGGTSAPPVMKLRGHYTHYDTGPFNRAMGKVETTIDTAKKTTFTQVEQKGTTIFAPDVNGMTDLRIDTAGTTTNYAAGNATLGHDTDTVPGVNSAIASGIYYASPGDAFRQYYFANSGEPINMLIGQSIFDESTATDSSRIAEARVRSYNASGAEGFGGVSFYAFMPDINRYPSASTNSIGLLDYRVAAPYNATAANFLSNQSSVLANLGFTSGNVSDHLRQGPGLMVDWDKGRFLTQNVEFQHNGTPRTTAFASFGVVNNGAPNFLDGGAMHFEGELGNTPIAPHTTTTALGDLKVGHDIYGNTNGRIEGMVVNVAGQESTRNIPASYIFTTNGSSLIQITVPGGDLETGDHITLSGIVGPVNGIPASSLNGRDLVVTAGGATITVDTGAVANATGTSGNAFSLVAHGFSSQAAVLDTSHGLTAADFTNSRSGAPMRGFAAGLVKNETGGTLSTYASTANTVGGQIADVRVTPNGTAGSIDGSGTHIKTYQNGVGANPQMSGNFGGINSAYMSDKYYGAQQVSGNVGGTAATVGTGFITTATNDKSVSYSCTACKYTQWGVWASTVNNGTNDYVVEMMPYVAGQVTQNFDATKAAALDVATGSTGSATYNGAAYGSFVKNGSYVQNATGAMNATVDLANREVDSVNMSFGTVHGNNLTIATTAATPISATGDAVFTNTGVDVNWPSTGTTNSGVINGALFGPNAEEIGGNFVVNHTEGGYTLDGGGAFNGAR